MANRVTQGAGALLMATSVAACGYHHAAAMPLAPAAGNARADDAVLVQLERRHARQQER